LRGAALAVGTRGDDGSDGDEWKKRHACGTHWWWLLLSEGLLLLLFSFAIVLHGDLQRLFRLLKHCPELLQHRQGSLGTVTALPHVLCNLLRVRAGAELRLHRELVSFDDDLVEIAERFGDGVL